MAPRFWVGGTGNWDASTTTNWSATSGGAGGASVPGAGDDVTFNAASNGVAYTVTITATANCLSINIGNPATGALTLAGSAALNVAGSFTCANITRTFTSTITFTSTTTGNTLTFGGETFANIWIFDGVGGEWTVQDAWNNGAVTTNLITLTRGTLITNNQTITSAFASNNANVRTLTLGSTTWNCSTWNCFNSTNMTFNANTSVLNNTAAALNFNCGALAYNTVNLGVGTGTASPLLMRGINGTSVGSTFVTLTVTNSGGTGAALMLGFDLVVSGTFTVTGTSATSRIGIISGVNGVTPGTTRIITAGAVALTNVDFQDVQAAGAATPWTGTSLGDGRGNSNITFTTAVSRFWVGGTGSWSQSAHWAATSGGAGGVSVPLAQDTVTFNASSFSAGSQTVTIDMAFLGTDISFTGVTNTPTLSNATSFPTRGIFLFGAVTLVSGMNISGTSSQINLCTAINANITTGTKTWPTTVLTMCYGSAIYSLADTFTGAGTWQHFLGALTANNQNVLVAGFNSSTTGIRSIVMGSGTWECNGTGTIWSLATSTGMSLNPGTSTIKFTAVSASARTFAGGGLAYNVLWFAGGASSGSFTISGNNTFQQLRDDGSVAHSILFTVNSNQTIRQWTVSGTAGQLITINSTTTGVHYLTKVGEGQVSADFLNIQHSLAHPNYNVWFAGLNSVNNQGVATAGDGWFFTAPTFIADRIDTLATMGVG